MEFRKFVMTGYHLKVDETQSEQSFVVGHAILGACPVPFEANNSVISVRGPWSVVNM